jgi:hypothetical protein
MYWSPSATVSVPAGYAMTGGGCFVDLMQGPGVLLTASYPSSITTWECNASWHIGLSKARMTAYVVGIRPRDGTPPPSVQITSSPSAWAAHPSSDAQTSTLPGYVITGGGALAVVDHRSLSTFTGFASLSGFERFFEGQFLTGSYPISGGGVPTGWHASSKDHLYSSPGYVSAFAVNVKFN